jgi:hypothetical protein
MRGAPLGSVPERLGHFTIQERFTGPAADASAVTWRMRWLTPYLVRPAAHVTVLQTRWFARPPDSRRG